MNYTITILRQADRTAGPFRLRRTIRKRASRPCSKRLTLPLISPIPTARVLSELPKKDKAELLNSYVNKIYKGCGKSLSCRDICPAQIDIEHLLVNNNAAAVRKRYTK